MLKIKERLLSGLDFSKKHKYTVGPAIIIALGIFGYFMYSQDDGSLVTLQDTQAIRKSIITNVSGTGTISPTNTVTLKSKGSGDIRTIVIKAGTFVKQGRALISLDATTAYQKVQTAKVNLETAQLELDKLKQPADTLEVLQIKNQIAAAQQKIKDQDTVVANAYTSYLNTSFEAVPEIQATNQIPPTISGSYAGNIEGQIKVTTYLSGNGLRFTVSGIAQGDGLASVTTAQPLGDSGLYIKFASLESQPNWIINIPNKKSSSYLSSYTSYQNTLINKEKVITETERTLAELTMRLEKLEAGADTLDVRARELVVAQRRNDLMEANAELANYTVYAPFDGTIASVTSEVGDSVSQSSSLGTIITNKKIAEIALNEVDITKVAVGQKVSLTFDAVEDMVINGTIAEIDTLGTTSQGVVTYKVKIAFDDSDTRIKPGMTVSAEIELDRKDNVIVVPSEAVKTVRGKKYVEVRDVASKEINATVQIEVVTGVTNDTETEIVSGLEENAFIVLRRMTTARAPGTSTQSASFMGGSSGVRTTPAGSARPF